MKDCCSKRGACCMGDAGCSKTPSVRQCTRMGIEGTLNIYYHNNGSTQIYRTQHVKREKRTPGLKTCQGVDVHVYKMEGRRGRAQGRVHQSSTGSRNPGVCQPSRRLRTAHHDVDVTPRPLTRGGPSVIAITRRRPGPTLTPPRPRWQHAQPRPSFGNTPIDVPPPGLPRRRP